MGYNVTCDWCNGLVLKTNKPSDIRAKLQEGEVVCDTCKEQVEGLKKYFESQKTRYVKQLEQVHTKAHKDLEKFIKNKSTDVNTDGVAVRQSLDKI